LLANPVCVFVVSGRTVTTFDLWFVDGVKRTDSTAALEDELVAAARKLADTAAAHRIPADTHALIVGDDLVGAASIAISVGIEDLVVSALTHAEAALQDFAGGALAAADAVVDQGFGAG